MSNSTSLSEEAAVSCVSSGTRVHDFPGFNPMVPINSEPPQQQPEKIKKKRNLPGNPDPDAEVIALSPKTLLATNRFVCEICNKGFQRDQNLQLHRRGHNLPWKLKQRNSKDVIKKRAYVCPEPTCVHHHPSRALGDLTGIKKHFCRKHGEKKWKCEKCSKIYAVQSDWKAHSKTCGTREYRCDCGTLFSRKDSFVTHRAFCDALAEESARLSAANPALLTPPPPPADNPTGHGLAFINIHHPQPPSLFPFSAHQPHHFQSPPPNISLNHWDPPRNPNPSPSQNPAVPIKAESIHLPNITSPYYQDKGFMGPTFRDLHVSTQPATSAHLSATALLQKAATFGTQAAGHVPSTMARLDVGQQLGTMGHVSTGIPPDYLGFGATWQRGERGLTRDFLGLAGEQQQQCNGNGNGGGNNVDISMSVRNMLPFTGGVEFPTYDRDHSLLKAHGFGFAEAAASGAWGNC
ncbi:hypothetical protein RJ640_019693 [Escallonia rubra]|uniref:C2H2-type domain-containing protein n=1 Tax=Escallonia rubra TaxID=112253 RepID=A0AA88UMU0_9ASTE|nr:hypothetical protein RJ640_019693 [Escallonia rubra]